MKSWLKNELCWKVNSGVNLETKHVMRLFFFDANVGKTAMIVNYDKGKKVVRFSWTFRIKKITLTGQGKFVADEMLLLFTQLQ